MTEGTSKNRRKKTAPRAQRVASGTGVDSAYLQLREAIVGGEIAPGAPLRHQELSQKLGLSLVPIREAMRRLQVERLVESVPNKGSRVARLSKADLNDVYASRVLLEEQALRLAWPRLTPDVLAELRELNRRLVDEVERSNPEFYEIHRMLHFAIYERADSPWLLHIIEILWSHTERYRRLAARVRPFVDVNDDLHHRVIDAIEAGDVDAAAQDLRRDLHRTVDLIADVYVADDASSL
jgi:DNA-binding GntR family transcriptional regulator